MRYAAHRIVRNEYLVPSKTVPVLMSKGSSHSRHSHCRSWSLDWSTTRSEPQPGLGHLALPDQATGPG